MSLSFFVTLQVSSLPPAVRKSFFLQRAWQPQAAMPAAEKNVRAAGGGEESGT